MLHQDHRFLSAILGSPADQSLRLVYADWLEERGDPRGGFLRIQCQLDGAAPAGEQYRALPRPRLPRRRTAHGAAPAGEQYRALQARADELRARCPTDWLAALGGPVWCVTANVVLERRYGPGGAEVRRGTKHFAPGAKVHVFEFFWGMGGEQVSVVGRHRKSKKYIALTMRAAHLANWRAELAYSPAVIRRLLEKGEFCRLARGSEESRKRAEEIAARYNQGGAGMQPFVTRPPGGERTEARERPTE